MKIAHLVLLLSLVGASAACSGGDITAPRDTATEVPASGSTLPDSVVNKDGGGVFGSGT